MKNLWILLIVLIAMVKGQENFFEAKSHIGGYGELHYNDNRTTGSRTLDFHRFVLFYGHDWTPTWSFLAEVELEHNFVQSGQGELELEQAYVDYHPSSLFGLRAGVVLAPIGIINLQHEPPTFLSVERPDYANLIIPTTWFGNGATIYGALGSFSYNFTVMEGLNGDNFKAASGIRGGRMKGYRAKADNPLTALRVDFHGVPGLTVGASYAVNRANRAQGEDIRLNIAELHAAYNAHNVIGVFEIGQITYQNYSSDRSFGYYFDLGYNVAALLNCRAAIIPWISWSDYNSAAVSDNTNHFRKGMIGLTVKPISEVVFKLDYGVQERASDQKQTKLLNLGVGYMF